MSEVKLTRRQVEFLLLAASGKNHTEIATLCHVSRLTVRNTLNEGRSRLEAKNDAQAIVKAIAQELLVVSEAGQLVTS